MNRKHFLQSLGGLAAACALQCFGFVDKIKAIDLVLQQKTLVGQVGTWTDIKIFYRLAPKNLKDDDPYYGEFEDPDEAYKYLGLEPPPRFDYSKYVDGWTPIL